jgi:hypothetical protein
VSPGVVLSPLDSDRFGVVVARAEDVTSEAVPEILAACRRQHVELLIARCDGADHLAARALVVAGLGLLEAQITYRGPLTDSTSAPGLREARPEDAEGVAALARIGFGEYGGHYHADPRLPTDGCRELYVDWALRGLRGEAADVVYVAEVEERLAAFGLFTLAGDEITFRLSVVAPWARGRRLYRAILARGMAWGRDAGASAVIGVVAHGTLPAHRNLIASGMRPVSSTSTFHGWRDQLDLS